MANEKNLDPVTTKSEARKRGRAGGIASAEARREKKKMRETLEIILKMPMKSGNHDDVAAILNFAAIKGKNISVQEAILIAQVQKAMKGDTRAAEYVRDMIGEKPADTLNLSGQINNPFDGLTTEELRRLVDEDG